MRLHLVNRWLPLTLLLTAACGDATGPAAELSLNRRKWITRRPASYMYEFERLCFCRPAVGPVRITVQGGVVQTVVSSSGDPIPPADVDAYFRVTIDSLFDILQDAARQPADHITVTYDARLGYPTEAFIDYEVGTADEELGFRATLLSP